MNDDHNKTWDKLKKIHLTTQQKIEMIRAVNEGTAIKDLAKTVADLNQALSAQNGKIPKKNG